MVPVLGIDSHYSLSTRKTVGTVNSNKRSLYGLYIGVLLEIGLGLGELTFEGYFRDSLPISLLRHRRLRAPLSVRTRNSKFFMGASFSSRLDGGDSYGRQVFTHG